MDQKQKKQRLIVLLILILIISVWRGIALDQPDTPVFDEFHYIAAAQLYAVGEEDANNWEHINWEHPPLAKLLLSVGITIFGDNSLGWRIIPYILGILSTVLVFLIAEALGFSLIGASIATLIFGFDFLSFSLGRLAMLDVFVTFFSLLAWASALFYHRYRHRKYFFFSILACGFAVASKWSGLFPVLLIGVYYLAVPPFFQRLGKLRYLASGGLVLPMCMFRTQFPGGPGRACLSQFGFSIESIGQVLLKLNWQLATLSFGCLAS
ncbi:MAG: phospholipid carrier-dependent glycosyltransferase [Coprothermobacterota bacterium]|nr:phospholipid carrier-dependent glycosyltransferase [Coprothermobacterota bacterium]